ncbi:MAG: M56 family metallopeptidase [Nonlabens sp.]|uniref:M56 family metallopeptidase n=1 Tax=Nonlabens sp. TaxID=1888209 RepID=UPI003286D7FB
MAYKLLLENTSWHSFKRFYLIGALIISIIIPFIVVKTIIIPIEEIPFVDYSSLVITETMVDQPSFEIDWFYVFSGIYIIGVAIMLWRFGKNLSSFRIQQEDEISSYKAYQLILRNHLTIPHSFLKRIFISKKDHESNNIPKVILEHEKAHLDQKHSLDILFIELLLIVLWFNPLLYIIRYSIKLNHEFLADSAVLNQGISTVSYQEVLLKHATTSYQQAMANTFTFPIIKKRFNIMKTHTSNTSLVLRSLALIPILALLVISCGKEETEFIEVEETIIEVEEIPTNKKLIIVDPTDSEGKITIQGKPHFYKITEDKIDIYNEHGELQDFESQGYEIRRTDEEIEIIEVLENVTSKDIEEYNFQAKKHQKFIEEKGHVVVFKEDTKRMQLIFNSMSDQQKAENEPWPYLYWDNDITPGDIPPPPPPAAPSKVQGYIKVDGKIHYYTIKENDKAFYDRWGNKIDVKDKTVEYLDQKDLPPPPPADPIDYIKNSGDNMNYYINDVKVNAEKAKVFIEKNGNKGVQIMPVNGVNSLKMTSEKSDSWKNVSYFSNEGATKSSKNSSSASIKVSSSDSETPSINKDQDREDYNSRMLILRVSQEQKKPISYLINNRNSTMNEVHAFITSNHDCGVSFNENTRVLHMYNKSKEKMSADQLQKIYEMLFKEHKPKDEKVKFTMVRETQWKVVTIDATVNKGAFKRNGANYTYDSSNLSQIKIFDSKGKLLNDIEYKNLAVGFNPVWIDGEQKYQELLKQPEIIEGFNNGTYAVFYRVGNKSNYTKNYKEALKIDASNTFLWLGSTLESTTIQLDPHSWSNTNPSYKQFQKKVKK